MYADEVRRSLKILAALRELRPSDLFIRRVPVPNKDLISVVVPMRNATRWIDLCLKSVLAQTYDHLEVFCIDDCSADDTYDHVVRRFGGDRRLAVFRLARRVGPYQIKNWVLAELARGRLIALQDADDVSHPTRLAEQAAWMRQHRLRVCGTCVHQFFPAGIRPRSGTRILLHGGGYRHSLAIYPHVPAVREQVGFQGLLSAGRGVLCKHGSQVFERGLLLEFGGFDGHTILGGDSDLNRRLLRYVDIGNVPKVLYSRRLHHRSLTRHPATGHHSPARRQYFAEREALQERIVRALADGDGRSAKALSTADLFYADLAVAESHSWSSAKGR
jgi:glycosyltransferase involved in cell wall biosynthesis